MAVVAALLRSPRLPSVSPVTPPLAARRVCVGDFANRLASRPSASLFIARNRSATGSGYASAILQIVSLVGLLPPFLSPVGSPLAAAGYAPAILQIASLVASLLPLWGRQEREDGFAVSSPLVGLRPAFLSPVTGLGPAPGTRLRPPLWGKIERMSYALATAPKSGKTKPATRFPGEGRGAGLFHVDVIFRNAAKNRGLTSCW